MDTRGILLALANGKIPWQAVCFPCNIAGERPYFGIDVLLLNVATDKHNFKTPYWGTEHQWEAQGRKLLLDAIPTPISQCAVFNLDQVDGGFVELRNKVYTPQYVKAELVFQGIDIRFEPGAEAHYHYPPIDYIRVPPLQEFLLGPTGLAGYYNTIFHEAGHWTEAQLGWKGSVEESELRAEMIADFCVSKLHLPVLKHEYRANHKKYLRSWLELLEREPAKLFKLAEETSLAMEYLLRRGIESTCSP